MYSHSLDEGFKSSSYLTETLLDPELGHAHQPNKTALNKAFNTKEDPWVWIEAPHNRYRLARFGAGMNGFKNMSPSENTLEGTAMLVSFCTIEELSGRVRLGTAPRRLADRRRWRRRRLTVLSARQPSPPPSFRYSRPRTSRTRCSRRMCIVIHHAPRSVICTDNMTCLTVLEEEHARRSRIWTREAPKFVLIFTFILSRLA